MKTHTLLALIGATTSIFALSYCNQKTEEPAMAPAEVVSTPDTLEPVIVTERVAHDSDDPAIWVNPEDPSKSIIFGTDKDVNGHIYAFDLDGKIIPEKTLDNVQKPNNVDVEYGLAWNYQKVDILVYTERVTRSIRVVSIPDMQFIDGGGIPVFEGEPAGDFHEPMGVSLYANPENGNIYAIVGRKFGPTDGTYLWQYQLETDAEGVVRGTVVRKFGGFSGKKEIEAIAVDDANGLVFYSDEGVGVHCYHADPAKGDEAVKLFGAGEFEDDVEGIAISQNANGFIAVSDQQAQAIRFYSSVNYRSQGSITYKALDTDGIEISNTHFNDQFPEGILVAMSTDKTFHYYDLRTIKNRVGE